MEKIDKIKPLLRFPAFIQDGGWKEQKFGSLFAFLPNNTLSRADLKEGKGDVYNVHYGDVLIKLDAYTDIQRDKLPAIKTVDDIEKYRKACLQDGDIVIADTAEDETVGKCTEIVNVHNTLVVSGLHTIPCRPQTKFAQAYLGYYMNSNAFHNKLLPIMQGVKVTSISKSALQNIDLEFPESLEEQQKIAECLSSIGSYISSINEKVEQLKAHKKSLLQKLFPQNGKNVPDYRFPEFEKDGMWGEKCFGDCLDYEQPQQYLVSSDNYKKEGTPVLTAGKTFVLGFTDESYGIYRQLPVIIFDDFTTASRYVNFPFKAKSSAMKMLQNKDGYDLKFMFEALQNYKYEPKEHQRHWISIFQNFKTLVPSYSEQRKIAECLFSIDKIIEYYSEKASQLVQHKKGIMQQLFPINR